MVHVHPYPHYEFHMCVCPFRPHSAHVERVLLYIVLKSTRANKKRRLADLAESGFKANLENSIVSNLIFFLCFRFIVVAPLSWVIFLAFVSSELCI